MQYPTESFLFISMISPFLLFLHMEKKKIPFFHT